MAAVVKHVRLRDGVYQYERRIPQDIVRNRAALERHFGVRNGLFRRSLHTRNSDEIHLAADVHRRDYETRVAVARGQLQRQVVTPTGLLKTVTSEILAEIREQQRHSVLRPWIDAYLLAEQSEQHAEELERMQHERELDAEVTKSKLTKPGATSDGGFADTPFEIAQELIDTLGLNAPEGSHERSLIALAVRQGRLAGEEGVDLVLAGKLPFSNGDRGAKPRRSLNGPTLRDAVDRHLADAQVRPKTASDIRASLELFERVVGNKRLSDLTRQDFKRFIEQLATKQVGGRSPGSVVRMIGPGTVGKRLAFLRAAINHAIEMDMHEGGNPAMGIDVSAYVRSPDKSLMPNKRPFNLTELNLVFRHPWFTGCASLEQTHEPGDVRLAGAYFWAPIVALFTGCRASELGGLKLNEIELDGACPHIHIRDNQYRPTKGGYARFVPLVDALMHLRFAEYVGNMRAAGADRLFPDWQSPKGSGNFDKDDAAWSNAGVIRAFNRTVILHTLADRMTPGARREVTFHSFRGAFKSMLGLTRHNVPPNVINEVIGHSKSELDQRYVGTVPIEETYAAIHRCTWENLQLPAPPLGTLHPMGKVD